MTELANTGTGEISLLNGLALQARTLAQSAAMNMLQLGRVLCEAKPLVQHGEWDKWIRENAYMKRRTAETYMQAYKVFGLNAQIAEFGTTKIMKLLPMNEEEREELLSEHDVSAMSTRQLDEAIRQQKEKLVQEARAEVQGEIDREREARIAAEQRAEAAESRPPELPEEFKAELESARGIVKEQQEKIDLLSKAEQERYTQHQQAICENMRLKQEIREKDELIEEQQEEYNRTQAELLDVKSSIAKGDAERMPLDQLTPDAFASAVRTFIGSCARMPHMAAAFSVMNDEERRMYDELLQTVESWAKGSRKALDTVTVEGVVIERV